MLASWLAKWMYKRGNHFAVGKEADFAAVRRMTSWQRLPFLQFWFPGAGRRHDLVAPRLLAEARGTDSDGHKATLRAELPLFRPEVATARRLREVYGSPVSDPSPGPGFFLVLALVAAIFLGMVLARTRVAWVYIRGEYKDDSIVRLETEGFAIKEGDAVEVGSATGKVVRVAPGEAWARVRWTDSAASTAAGTAHCAVHVDPVRLYRVLLAWAADRLRLRGAL